MCFNSVTTVKICQFPSMWPIPDRAKVLYRAEKSNAYIYKG